jgi:hypothetical protein
MVCMVFSPTQGVEMEAFNPDTDAVLRKLGRELVHPGRQCTITTAEGGFELTFPGSEPEVFPTQDAAVARFTRRASRRDPKPRLFWRGRRPGMEPVQVYPDTLRDRYEADRRATIFELNGQIDPLAEVLS